MSAVADISMAVVGKPKKPHAEEAAQGLIRIAALELFGVVRNEDLAISAGWGHRLRLKRACGETRHLASQELVQETG